MKKFNIGAAIEVSLSHEIEAENEEKAIVIMDKFIDEKMGDLDFSVMEYFTSEVSE